MSRPTHHSFLYVKSPRVRVTNCELIDLSTAPHSIVNAYWNNGVCFHSAIEMFSTVDNGSLLWFENNVMVHPMVSKPLPMDLRQAQSAVSMGGYLNPRHITFRNCAVGGYQVCATNEATSGREYIKYEHNTVMARPVGLINETPTRSSRFQDNLVICPSNPIPADPPGLIDRLTATGSHNAVWLTAANFSAAARDDGSLRLLPGPVLTAMPTFAGRPTNEDLLRPFRLNPKQKYGSMASDGGPIGVNLDYLP